MATTRIFTFLALVGLIIAVGSCRVGENGSQTPEATRVVRDDLGNSIKLPEKVTRAVSLAPNLTEIAFAVGAGDRLVGVTTFCNYPAKTKDINKVGDTLKPNIEKIVALRPQVVLVTTASQLESFSKVLQNQGIEVFVTNPTSLDGVYDGISKIGQIFGETKNAGVLVDGMKRRIAKLGAADKEETPPTVFVQIDKSLYTIGKKSFISDAISRLSLKSVTDDIDDPYPKISKERARSLNPDLIIITDSPGNEDTNVVFAASSAVRDKRVYKVNADTLSRPGPRIVEALEGIYEQERLWKARASKK